MLVRRVVGSSMEPVLRAGQIVIARRSSIHTGDIVVLHHDGIEKIKRIADVRQADGSVELLVLGDNPAASTDGRHFGWLPAGAVRGRVIWPKNLRRK